MKPGPSPKLWHECGLELQDFLKVRASNSSLLMSDVYHMSIIFTSGNLVFSHLLHSEQEIFGAIFPSPSKKHMNDSASIYFGQAEFQWSMF